VGEGEKEGKGAGPCCDHLWCLWWGGFVLIGVHGPVVGEKKGGRGVCLTWLCGGVGGGCEVG